MGMDPLESRHTATKRKAWNERQRQLQKDGTVPPGPESGDSLHKTAGMQAPTDDDLGMSGDDFEGYYLTLP